MAKEINMEREICSSNIKALLKSCKSKYGGGAAWNIFWKRIVYGALPSSVKFEKNVSGDFVSITLIDSKNTKLIDQTSLPIRYERLLYACMSILNSKLLLTVYSSWQLVEPYDPYIYFEEALKPFEEIYQGKLKTQQNNTTVAISLDRIICEEEITTTSPQPEFIAKKTQGISNKKLKK